MKRASVSGRRTFVYVAGRAACVMWGRRKGSAWGHWDAQHTFSAYDMTCYRKLPQIGDRRDRHGDLTWDAQCGQAVARLVDGGDLPLGNRASSIVYAFYSHENRCVKIGRTSDLLRRWTKLEHESGQRRQLLSVWRTLSAPDFEHELHVRWLAHRTFGEWFDAAPVLTDLGLRLVQSGPVGHRVRRYLDQQSADDPIAARAS